jgi:hypothetical protein
MQTIRPEIHRYRWLKSQLPNEVRQQLQGIQNTIVSVREMLADGEITDKQWELFRDGIELLPFVAAISRKPSGDLGTAMSNRQRIVRRDIPPFHSGEPVRWLSEGKIQRGTVMIESEGCVRVFLDGSAMSTVLFRQEVFRDTPDDLKSIAAYAHERAEDLHAAADCLLMELDAREQPDGEP